MANNRNILNLKAMIRQSGLQAYMPSLSQSEWVSGSHIIASQLDNPAYQAATSLLAAALRSEGVEQLSCFKQRLADSIKESFGGKLPVYLGEDAMNRAIDQFAGLCLNAAMDTRASRIASQTVDERARD